MWNPLISFDLILFPGKKFARNMFIFSQQVIVDILSNLTLFEWEVPVKTPVEKEVETCVSTPREVAIFLLF